MTDGGFDPFYELDLRALSYQDEEWQPTSDLSSELAFLDSNADFSDNIEQLYTWLHKSVDQVVTQISICMPPQLDQIREQNRKLIDKLTTLEGNITDGTAVAHVTSDLDPCISASTPVPGVDQIRSDSKRRRISHTKGASSREMQPSIPDTSDPSLPRSDSLQHQSLGEGDPVVEGLQGDTKLAKKLLQISLEEARIRVAQFAAQLDVPEYQSALPNMYQFSSVSRTTDASHFLRLVLDLGLAIETNFFGEQSCRVKKRIALAHFYHAYTLAQNNPLVFLSWCDDQQVQSGRLLPKGGRKSIVQQRFADLIFSQTDGRDGGSPPNGPLERSDDISRRNAKIQMWRKSGKKWAQFIQRFGYGILLLLPYSLSDEEVRVTQDKAFAFALDLIDSRKHLFADVLQQANEILEARVFIQDKNAQLPNASSSSALERAHWDNLLKTPNRGNNRKVS